eukprot:356698-Chlamydomonas_euryale.AAC.9
MAAAATRRDALRALPQLCQLRARSPGAASVTATSRATRGPSRRPSCDRRARQPSSAVQPR